MGFSLLSQKGTIPVTATGARRDMKRKLTTIFCADVSGYSRMMGADEARTLATLKEYREAIEGFIARHHGRVVSWSGDGLLAEFESVVEAVQCAAEVQRELKARNASRDEHLRMTFRIGINLGDVMADDDDIFGEGVNIAARLQQMAVAGGILVSSPVYDQVRGKLSMGFASLGNQSVKNIAGEVSVYAVTMEGVAAHDVSSVPPSQQRWAEGPPDGAGAVRGEGKRGGLFRRGAALVVDYAIVAMGCLVGALALNTFVSPTIVRMDLDLPLIKYGDMRPDSPWREIGLVRRGDAVIRTQERTVTYDYLGLFAQHYYQKRDCVIRNRSTRQSSADPAQPPPPPVPPPLGAVPSASPPPPLETTEDGCGSGEHGSWNLSLDWDEDDELSFSFSDIDETLIDAQSLQQITRPSLDMLSFAVLLIYLVLFEASRSGATIGKSAFDVRVTREDGKRLSLGKALGRNLVKVPTIAIAPIAFLVALFSRRRQGIHDRIARTLVVHQLS